MRELTFYHAQPIHDQSNEQFEATINFLAPITDGRQGYAHGLELADELLTILPGSSIDGLLVGLLEHRRSGLVVSYQRLGQIKVTK